MQHRTRTRLFEVQTSDGVHVHKKDEIKEKILFNSNPSHIRPLNMPRSIWVHVDIVVFFSFVRFFLQHSYQFPHIYSFMSFLLYHQMLHVIYWLFVRFLLLAIDSSYLFAAWAILPIFLPSSEHAHFNNDK